MKSKRSSMKNEFGGQWTETKIEILVKYTQAYLTIMNKFPFKLIYFDGFAGDGEIMIGNEDDYKKIEGAAKKIVGINLPRSFDIYYFVELDQDKRYDLEGKLHQIRTDNVFVVNDDCNLRLKKLAKFLEDNQNYRALIFLDPFGMNLDWSSLELFREKGVDVWILSPTGIGAGRGLKRRIEKIPPGWWKRLELFFGVDRTKIQESFYEKKEENDLFGTRTINTKITKNNKMLFKLYADKTKMIFKHVSDPYIIVNQNNSLMYHFFCASNNATAIKIANEIVKSQSPISFK
jgi:three-Cys-motif partner protein